MMIEIMANAIAQVESGSLRILAVSTAERWPKLPSVPTIAESGMPGFFVTAWDALVVPKGTPEAIVSRLNEATNKALARTDLQQNLLSRGASAVPGTPAALRTFMQDEFKRWSDVVKESNAKID